MEKKTLEQNKKGLKELGWFSIPEDVINTDVTQAWRNKIIKLWVSENKPLDGDNICLDEANRRKRKKTQTGTACKKPIHTGQMTKE